MQEYQRLRQELIERDKETHADAEIRRRLTPAEMLVNMWLCRERQTDLAAYMHKYDLHPAQDSIIRVKEELSRRSDEIPLWRVIKQMPKGAVLHLHFDSAVDVNWLIENVTYNDNCYVRHDRQNGGLLFRLMNNIALAKSTFHDWEHVPTMRARHSKGPRSYDAYLFEELTLKGAMRNPSTLESDTVIWSQFLKTFVAAAGLINHVSVFQAYIREKLERFMEDGVVYLEERMVVSATRLYDDDGIEQPIEHTMELYEEVVNEMRMKHSQFLGARLIYCGLKVTNEEAARNDMILAKMLKQKFPELIAGFDLVGYEDDGFGLADFASDLVVFRDDLKANGLDMPFVWHAGETVQSGTKADLNLYDALALGTHRIGHGLSLVKHPHLRKTIKERDIAIELCPISNKVLVGFIDGGAYPLRNELDAVYLKKYTPGDLRLHPLISFLHEGLAIVLSPDDPSIFCVGEHPASYDFWMATMSWDTFDIATLKHLAGNSIRYSLMSKQEKIDAMILWQKQWHAWIEWVRREFVCESC